MHYQSIFYAEEILLRKIQRIAPLIPGLNSGSRCAEPALCIDDRFMTLDLPFPHDILAPITTMALPDKIRQQLTDCFTRRLNEIRGRFLAIFRHTSKMARSINDLDAIRRGVQNIYNRRCLPLFREQISRLTESTKSQEQNHAERKRAFNNEYTPLLEKYFEYNAYPSASDRLALARKSMMTSRQIEVWFQNHRNRAKKEGKIFKRSSSVLPLQLSLNSLEVDPPSFTVSQQKRTPSDNDSSEDNDSAVEDLKVSRPTSSTDTFSCVAPPHAFPTPFPPKGVDDPFPHDNGIFRFVPPVWRRSPATRQPPSTPVDFDEFVAMFSKLNLQESSLTAVQSKRKVHNADHKPWFAATVTTPSRAPHPALVRRPLSPPSIASPTPTSSSQTSFHSRSEPIMTPTSCHLKPRKLAPLARRIPNTSSPTGYTSSPSPSSSRTSSTSSVSSATSCRSRSTSSSSLTDLDSSSPVAQPRIITDDMFEAFHDYINTKLQPRWTELSTTLTKEVSPFSLYQPSTLLPISDPNYLKAQS